MSSIQSSTGIELDLIAFSLPMPVPMPVGFEFEYAKYMRLVINDANCPEHHKEGIKTLLLRPDTKIRTKYMKPDNDQLGIRHAHILSNAAKTGTSPRGIGSGNNVGNNGKEINIFVPQNMPNEYNNCIYVFAKIPKIISSSPSDFTLQKQVSIQSYRMTTPEERRTIIQHIDTDNIIYTRKSEKKWWATKHHPNREIPKNIYLLGNGTLLELYQKYIAEYIKENDSPIEYKVFINYTRELIKQGIMY